MSNTNNSYGFEVTFYLVMFVVEVLVIRFGINVESWLASIVLAATVGTLGTWAITHVPDLLD